MFGKLLEALGLRPAKHLADREVTEMVRRMGGSVDRLSPQDRHRLTRLVSQAANIEAMTGKAKTDAFFDSLDNEKDRMRLLRAAGAFERIAQDSQDKMSDIKELFRTGFPLPPALQSMLDAVPIPALRDHLRQNLREAVLFRPVMPPKPMSHQTPCLSFFGGLPMAPDGFIWPRYTDAGGTPHPAHFIGQIDCAELPDFTLRHLYPAEGILFFFCPMAPEGYKALLDDMVLHLPARGEIRQCVPPASLEPYKRKQGAYGVFWLHELPHPHLPPRSVLPKWQIEMGIGVQLFTQDLYAGEGFTLARNDAAVLAAAGHRDLDAFTEHFVAAMQSDPGISFLATTDRGFHPNLKEDTGLTIGFEGFPHNFHAMHMMLGGYLDLLDEAQKTLYAYIAYAEGDPAPIYVRGDWQAAEHRQCHKQACVVTLHGLARRRLEICEMLQEMGTADLSAATSPQDRRAFWTLWRDLSSEGALKLETHMSDQWMPFHNHPNALNPIVENAARHCVLATACNGLDSFRSLPDALAQDWVAAHQPHLKAQRFWPQSLGFAPPTQNSEEEGYFALPLMQVPDAEFRDVSVGGMGALQYWIDLSDALRHDFSAVRIRAGN